VWHLYWLTVYVELQSVMLVMYVYIYTVTKKQNTWSFISALARMALFSRFFYSKIFKKVLYVPITNILSHLLCITALPYKTQHALWRNEKHAADILTRHERAITLVLGYQQRLVGDVPFHLKFALKLTHARQKCWLRPISAYNVSTARASDNVQL